MLEKVGAYDLVEKIGRGGMGVVYKGCHRSTRQIVAVKVLSSAMNPTSVGFKRFEQEFHAATRLSHPHIVKGLDFGVEGDHPYLVMEYVQGHNLSEQVQRFGCLPKSEAFSIICQIASALKAAHAIHLVHRDVKPDNILVTPDGDAKLADLGLVKDLDSMANLTHTGASLGTLQFMAPEQYGDAKHVDRRCDVYGLAATLFFALTGHLPFVGRGQTTILKQKLANEITPLTEFLPLLPQEVDRAICKALAAEPEERFASCRDFVDALRTSFPELEFPEVYEKSSEGRPVQSDAKLQLPQHLVERRVAVRYPSALRSCCWPVHNPDAPAYGELLDISTTGIRMDLARRFEAEALLVLNLVDAQNVVSLSGWVRVCWVRELTSGKWTHGCAFHRPLSDGELDTLVENKTDTKVTE